MAVTFDFYNSIIEVSAPATTIDIQTLINEIRDAEDELIPAMGYYKIADAYGKQSLGGGASAGITLVLLNNWRVRFQARLPCTDPSTQTVTCSITGGNLVAESGDPIAPSACTTVTISQSSSPTIITTAGAAAAAEIADAVWNEAISDHLSTGSTGKVLKDTKTKATLASLR